MKLLNSVQAPSTLSWALFKKTIMKKYYNSRLDPGQEFVPVLTPNLSTFNKVSKTMKSHQVPVMVSKASDIFGIRFSFFVTTEDTNQLSQDLLTCVNQRSR